MCNLYHSYTRQIWINIFNNQHLVEFNFQNYMKSNGYHQWKQYLASDVKFACQFPFFWLIKENIDSTFDLVRSSFGNS